MSRGPAVRRADVERAIAALEATGLGVARVEVHAGGSVHVIPGRPPDLTAAPPSAPADDLDGFRAAREAHRHAKRAAEGS